MSASVLIDMLMKGGFVTAVILVFAVIALIIVIERFLSLRRSQIDVQDFLPGVINTLRSQDVKQAVIICDETPGPAAHIVRQAIMHCEEGREGMYRAAREACLSELPRLERFMKALLTIVHVTPLLGLLGTVIGMLSILQNMDQSKAGIFMPMTEMAGDLQSALISTAAGLTVAIPTYLSYNYFRELIDNILIEMDKAAAEIIYFLSENPEQLPVEEHEIAPQDVADAVEAAPSVKDQEQAKARRVVDDTQELDPESKAGKLMRNLRGRVTDDDSGEDTGGTPTQAFMRSFGPGTKPAVAKEDAGEEEQKEKPGETPTEFFMRTLREDDDDDGREPPESPAAEPKETAREGSDG